MSLMITQESLKNGQNNIHKNWKAFLEIIKGMAEL